MQSQLFVQVRPSAVVPGAVWHWPSPRPQSSVGAQLPSVQAVVPVLPVEPDVEAVPVEPVLLELDEALLALADELECVPELELDEDVECVPVEPVLAVPGLGPQKPPAPT